jgi:A/G-specific adenine glycosylase
MSTSGPIIAWYQVNKRDLPWRHTRDPYAIWLSEVILQQTRVNQGMAYYYRFLELFPTVFDLAAASEDEVLKAWQGLGYYSRARNLHATAKRVAHEMAGVFPTSSDRLKTLKGVGDYTAAAIASFCYNECVPVLDGNVQRVVSRIMALEEPIDKPSTKTIMLEVLNEWIDRKHPALFNQAIMEFGALQCTPQKPNCAVCPLKSNCMAYEKGLQSLLPFKAGKTKVTDLWMYYIVVVHDDKVLVRHRRHSGIWKGLYDFPSIDSMVARSPDEIAKQWKHDRGVNGKWLLSGSPVELEHILSHRRVHAVFQEFKCESIIKTEESEQWIALHAFESLGVSRLVDRYIREHSQLLGGME